MNNTVIIIPTRLEAKRFPNKPLVKINNIPMIIHVLNRAQESEVGKVFVATPDNEIINLVRDNGGEAILTNKKHKSGSDRIYEAYLKELTNKNNIDLIINLQGDMPNIKPNSIKRLQYFMQRNECDIGTLASNINDKNEINDPNVVKVEIEKKLKDDNFCQAKNFFRKKENLSNEKTYHHIGIYAFTNIALTKYVSLARSKLEIDRNLEQMRAMENNLIIKVALCDSTPLGVDTQEDLLKVQKEMSK